VNELKSFDRKFLYFYTSFKHFLLKKTFLLSTLSLLLSCQSKTQETVSESDTPATDTLNSKPAQSPKALNKQLLLGGFLNFAESKKPVTESELNIYDESTNKYVYVDAEALTEFDFSFYGNQINRMLKKRNIQIPFQVSPDADETFSVFLGEKKIPLYTAAALKKGSHWVEGPRVFFSALNGQLKRKKCEEQFYLLYEGTNDLSAFLLTPSEHAILKEIYKNDSKEIPVLP
jgi:hypothetical protein